MLAKPAQAGLQTRPLLITAVTPARAAGVKAEATDAPWALQKALAAGWPQLTPHSRHQSRATASPLAVGIVGPV